MPLKHLTRAIALTLATCAVLAAQAHEFKLGAIQIGHPFARATAAGQTTGGGFLKLSNTGTADTLLSASSPVAARVELHSMRMDGDVMQMRQVDTIALPAGKTIELKPGGWHLMFVGLKAPLKAGAKFPLTLKFEHAGEIEVMVNVDALAPTATGATHSH